MVVHTKDGNGEGKECSCRFHHDDSCCYCCCCRCRCFCFCQFVIYEKTINFAVFFDVVRRFIEYTYEFLTLIVEKNYTDEQNKNYTDEQNTFTDSTVIVETRRVNERGASLKIAQAQVQV